MYTATAFDLACDTQAHCDNQLSGCDRSEQSSRQQRLAQQIVITALQGHLRLLPSDEAISHTQRCLLDLVSISSRSESERDSRGLIEAAIDETIHLAGLLRKTIRMPDMDA